MDISLEQARRRAKELLVAARAGDAAARARLREDREPRLADAQRAVAAELGFASWPALVAHLEATQGDRAARRARFLHHALHGRRDKAQPLLDHDPGLAGRSLACALVLGDADSVRAALTADPSRVEAPVEDTGLRPLHCVTQSAYLQPGSPREEALLATLELLIAAGADVNATFANEYGDMSVIYGAAGVAHNPRATRLLLDAGADPDDGESVYHASEAPDTACLELLLEAGATVSGTNAVGMALARHSSEHLRLLLEHGGLAPDDDELAPRLLHTNSVACARLLLAHGANVMARDRDGLTPYDHAVRMGHDELAELLADAGGAHDPDPVCTWLGAVLRGEAAGPAPGPLRHADGELLPRWASAGEDVKVARLLDAGVPIESPGVDGGTALCYAGLWGRPSTVALLISRGADIHTHRGPGTPLGWIVWGAGSLGHDVDAAIACARLLLKAGARPSAADVEHAPEDLADVLRPYCATATSDPLDRA